MRSRTALLLSFGLVWSCIATLQAGERLRLMAFNAECLADPSARPKPERFRWAPARLAHLERVAGLIEALEPDLVNLEEVVGRPAVDKLVEILHEKGLAAYRGYFAKSADTFTGFSIAVVSRLPLDEIDGEALRCVFTASNGDGPWREPYTYLDFSGQERRRSTSISRNGVYYLTVSRRKLGFLGLHLKANPDDPASNAQRTAEAHIAQKIIRQEIVARGYLPIVLGDLNDYDPDISDRDESRSTHTTVLADLKDYDPETIGPELVNAASLIVRQSDRFTSHWDRNENGALDGDDVRTMIDHVLVHKDLRLRKAFICHVSDLRVSDHWPVVVDLDL